MFATGGTVGLAEWIIDDPCLVFLLFLIFHFQGILDYSTLPQNCGSTAIFSLVPQPWKKGIAPRSWVAKKSKFCH